jgi:hypothetical protein
MNWKIFQRLWELAHPERFELPALRERKQEAFAQVFWPGRGGIQSGSRRAE